MIVCHWRCRLKYRLSKYSQKIGILVIRSVIFMSDIHICMMSGIHICMQIFVKFKWLNSHFLPFFKNRKLNANNNFWIDITSSQQLREYETYPTSYIIINVIITNKCRYMWLLWFQEFSYLFTGKKVASMLALIALLSNWGKSLALIGSWN